MSSWSSGGGCGRSCGGAPGNRGGTSDLAPSVSGFVKEYLPELVCRVGKLVDAAVWSGTRRLLQKGVERRVAGDAPD